MCFIDCCDSFACLPVCLSLRLSACLCPIVSSFVCLFWGGFIGFRICFYSGCIWVRFGSGLGFIWVVFGVGFDVGFDVGCCVGSMWVYLGLYCGSILSLICLI